jgi:hypothetical protein
MKGKQLVIHNLFLEQAFVDLAIKYAENPIPQQTVEEYKDFVPDLVSVYETTRYMNDQSLNVAID